MKFSSKIFILLLSTVYLISPTFAEQLYLRDNLRLAQAGDYLVISANKTQTLMHIYNKKNNVLTIEEIAIPTCKRSSDLSWKNWVNMGAPNNTSWVMYDVDLQTGQMIRYYSFTKKNWFDIPEADNFLSKLLTLKFTKIPENQRKKIGPKSNSEFDFRPLWQPRLIQDGRPVKGVEFNAWRTKWPNDGSDLSNKIIEIYLPQDSQRYPTYFPYWLQINGAAGKAKIRIIDSGSQLHSPKNYPK